MSFITKAVSPNKGGTKLKKIVHNDNERKRKKRMIEMIDKIVELIPMKCGGKTSRIGRLEKLHSYIIELKNKNDGLMFANPNSVYVQEIKCLKKYIEHLERLNRNYHKLLKLAGISPASAVEMGDRDWKKPLKYSNQVSLESDETTMNDLTRRNRANGSSDGSEKSVEDESVSSESEENHTSPDKGTPIQLVNSAPILSQEAQSVQYVLLSVRPNTHAQFVPLATPILSNGISSPTIILGSNLSTTPCTSQNSLSKAQQEKSINSKLETEKNESKRKKNANLKENNHKEKTESLNNNQTVTSKDFSKVSNLTTTIVENNDKPEKETATESQIDAANNVQGQQKRPVDHKRQNNKRNSIISESVRNLMSKKTKSDNLTQLENPEKKQPVAEKMLLPDPLTPVGSPKKSSLSTKPSMTSTSTIVYNYSNDSVVPDKLMPNSTARGDYSTERLLQQQPMLPAATVESQASKSSSGRETCSLNQPLQSSGTEAEQPPSYQQQNTPRFTVKNTFINCSPPNNAQGEKPNFDMNSQIKRSLLDMSETQGIPSSTTTTPHLFDPMPSISTTEYQQQSLMPFVTWSTEPTGSHNSTSSGSTNATSGAQPYGNTNHASVLFANQPPFSILSTTTPTPFDPSAVSNVAVFSASPHKPPAPSNSSIAFNSLMADFNSTSYSLANSDDQHNQTEVSIIDSFPRSSRSASSISVATRSQSARSSAVTTASNTSVSYGKAKTSSSKATTLTTSTSSTRAKSNALNPKKNLNKSSSSATSSSITEPKSSLPTSSVTSSTPSNLFARHHHPHHSHPTQPSNRHILNDNYLQHIIPEIVSVNSGHSSSVLGSNSIAHTSTPTGPTTTFHPSHSHTHHPHQFQSYTNFFAPSQSQTSFEPYDSPHVNGSDTGTPNDISEHNQLSCYPIYRPQSQTSHAIAPTNIYPSGQSSSSTLQTRNFANPPTYTHPHSSGTSSSHVTNFNIYNLLPDTNLPALNSSGTTGSYGSSEFLSASKVQSSSASTSLTSSTSAATSLTTNTLLPKFAQLAKSLPSSVSSSIVDPFACSSAYQNPSTAHHPPQYHHPATHHPFYPPPPTAASQTSVTYSTSHPLNSHFTSSSAISNQSRNPGRSSAFVSSEDHDSEAVMRANSANTRASSLGHFYPIPPHNSGVTDMSNMFTPSGITNQNSSQHGQSASSHHLPQHPHFSANVATSHAFNQASTIPTSISNFNIQSSISIGNGSGSTSAFGSAPSAPNQRIPFTLFNL